MEQLEKDGYVKLEYDKDSESPQLVERILGIRSAEEQEEKEAEYEKESQESRTFCFYGCLSVAGVALIPVIYFGGKSYLVNRAKIKNKKE